MKIAKLLGFMTAAEALDCGMTHHARYYFIPIWIGHPYSTSPSVATKWYPFEYLIVPVGIIEALMNALLNRPGAFMFTIGKEIDRQ